MTLDDWLTQSGTTAEVLRAHLGIKAAQMSKLRRHRRVPTAEERRKIARFTKGAVTDADWDTQLDPPRLGMPPRKGIWMAFRRGRPEPATAALLPEQTWVKAGYRRVPPADVQRADGVAVVMVAEINWRQPTSMASPRKPRAPRRPKA